MFDVGEFKQSLQNQVAEKKLSQETADYYIHCVKELNKHIEQGNSAKAIATAINTICKGNSQGRKYIAAVKKYERDVRGKPKSLLYGEALAELYEAYTVKSQGKKLSLPEATYSHKINAIRNEKLKLALRLQKSSGLRISEIAKLDKIHILFLDEGKILLRVVEGKGRKDRTVTIEGDWYLYEALQEHLVDKESGELLFYSKSYLKKLAGQYQMPTHDLRRVNARKRFRKQREKGAGKRSARREVANQLGHEKPKITNAYLGDDWEEE